MAFSLLIKGAGLLGLPADGRVRGRSRALHRHCAARVGGSYWRVPLYVMAAALISFVSVYLAPESFREDLDEDLDEDLASESGATARGAGQTT